MANGTCVTPAVEQGWINELARLAEIGAVKIARREIDKMLMASAKKQYQRNLETLSK